MAFHELEERAMNDGRKPARGGAGKRGRPVQMPAEKVLSEIRTIACGAHGLFRVHRTRPDLYAAARRRFGSWATAVAAAGFDYGETVARARARSIETRRRARARGRSR